MAQTHSNFSLPPILTDPKMQRIILLCDVPALSPVLNELRSGGVTVEHIYDY